MTYMCSHPELRQQSNMRSASLGTHREVDIDGNNDGKASLPLLPQTQTQSGQGHPRVLTAASAHDALREVAETTSATAKDVQSIRVTCFGPRRLFFFLTVTVHSDAVGSPRRDRFSVFRRHRR